MGEEFVGFFLAVSLAQCLRAQEPSPGGARLLASGERSAPGRPIGKGRATATGPVLRLELTRALPAPSTPPHTCSATLPNAFQFAQWVSYIHTQPCHVVYTGGRCTGQAGRGPAPVAAGALPLLLSSGNPGSAQRAARCERVVPCLRAAPIYRSANPRACRLPPHPAGSLRLPAGRQGPVPGECMLAPCACGALRLWCPARPPDLAPSCPGASARGAVREVPGAVSATK